MLTPFLIQTNKVLHRKKIFGVNEIFNQIGIKKILTGIMLISVPAFFMGSTPVVAIETVTQSHSCPSIPMQTINWNLSCQLPQFNPTLGVLESVEFSIQTDIESDVRVESEDALSSTITGNVSVQIGLKRPNNTDIVSAIPTIVTTDNFTAFDGTIDYNGTSGKTYLGLTASETDTVTTTDITDLNLFTGAGNINLPITTQGNSSFTGAANVINSVNTRAGAAVNIIYTYQRQDLAIDLSHSGFFTENVNGVYTISVTNNDPNPTVGTITVENTIPNGLTYLSNTNPNWLCVAVGQLLTCTSNTIINAGATDSFDVTVSVSSSTASQIINIGSVSSSIVDPNLLDNNDTDPIIVNHLPTADSKILSSVSNQNQLELPDGTLSGDPQDILDTIINYQIFSLPDPICATLYLGDPLNGGTLVSAGQTLTPLQANNLYILPLQTCSQTVSFEYLTQDSFLAWSQEPAQIRISFSSIITTGTTIDISRPIVRPIVVVPQTVTNNPTQVLTIEPTTESKTQSLPQVLGASEKTVDQPDQNLIRTGSPVENNGWFQQDTLLLSELVISSIFLIYSIQIRREEKVLD